VNAIKLHLGSWLAIRSALDIDEPVKCRSGRDVLQANLTARDELAVVGPAELDLPELLRTSSRPLLWGRKKSVELATPTARSPRSLTASNAPVVANDSTTVAYSPP
jgi:hypothetical protein